MVLSCRVEDARQHIRTHGRPNVAGSTHLICIASFSTRYLFGADIAHICTFTSVPGINLRHIPVAMWLPLTYFARHIGS